MFGVLTLTLTHFLAKKKFSTGYGGAHNALGNSRGMGRLFFEFRKVEILERLRVLHEIPSVVGVWIFSGTTCNKYWQFETSSTLQGRQEWSRYGRLLLSSKLLIIFLEHYLSLSFSSSALFLNHFAQAWKEKWRYQ